MSKYWHVINIGIQNTLTYRVNFLFRASFGLVPLMATLFLWRTVYAGQSGSGQVGAYSLAEMTSYYLVVTIVDALTAVTEDDWQIAADIREGNISQFLLKPIDYFAYRLCLYGTGRLVYTGVAFFPVALFLFFQRDYFQPPPDLAALGWFLCSVFLAAILQFLISFTMALLAFWVLEVSTFIFIVFAIEYIAGGHLFPLDLLPTWLASLMKWTPFYYQLFLPVSIYHGRIAGLDLLQGIAVQALWVLIMAGVARFVWRRGIRHYSAFGG